MKVLLIHTRYKLRGGEDSVVDNEAELLKKQGNQVATLFFNNAGNTLLKLLQLPFNLGAYRKTLASIKSFNPDVIHLHNMHFSGSAAIIYAARKANVPLVVTLHNYRLICPSGSLFHKGKIFMDSVGSSFPWAAVQAGVYQQSRSITFWLALSNYWHQRLGTYKSVGQFILLGDYPKEIFATSALGKYSDKMVVKPNFSPHIQEAVADGNQQSHYLYIGRLTEEKGIKVLLAAFAKNKLPLIIVGTGPLQEAVQSAAENHPNISYAGELPLNKIYTLLQDTIALIFPSTWYETFGMVAIEAFSKGVPVIASDLGNMKCIVTHQYNGLTFQPGNADDLSKVVLGYHQLEAAEKAIYQSNAVRTYQEKYTPDVNYAQLMQIYHTAIKALK